MRSISIGRLRALNFPTKWIGAMILATLAALPSCLKPLDGDFPNKGQGLEDNELLWVLRIAATPGDADLKGNITAEDSARFVSLNQPLFSEGVQSIVKRILNGELKASEEYPGDIELKNPRERLIQMGGTVQNIDPLLKVVELYVVLDINQPAYNGRPEFLRLIWRDPLGREADRGFGGIRLDQGEAVTYRIGSKSLTDFALEEKFFALPVYLRTNFREYAIRSFDEARYVQRMVRDGEWNGIQWESDGINVSGRKKVKLDPETVLVLGGSFQFPEMAVGDSNTVPELFLTAEHDYLVADWSNRFQVEKIWPYEQWNFFSRDGELYQFKTDADSNLVLFVISDGDTLVSWRETDY
jgi:hypothetical protein